MQIYIIYGSIFSGSKPKTAELHTGLSTGSAHKIAPVFDLMQYKNPSPEAAKISPSGAIATDPYMLFFVFTRQRIAPEAPSKATMLPSKVAAYTSPFTSIAGEEAMKFCKRRFHFNLPLFWSRA